MIQFLSLNPAFPEVLMLTGFVVILLIDLFLTGKKAFSFWLVEILLVLTFCSLMMEQNLPPQILFQGHYVIDGFSTLFKAFAVAFTFLLLIYTRQRDEFQAHRSEYLFLILLSLIGAMVLCSAASLLTLYLGLELLSLPTYALVALKRDCPRAGEAAIKYFVMGAVSSGFLLYGFSLLYGLTGSTLLPQLISVLTSSGAATPVLWVAAVMIFAAVAFKMGIVPFHLWIADVYEGSPLSVTAYIATVSKLAALTLFLRLLTVSTTLNLHIVFFSFGLLSLTLGSATALMQKNLRRFLGYSTIANMGIVLIALGCVDTLALSAVFYVLAYTTASLALFGLLLSFQRDLILIDDLKGLHQKKPFTAFLFLLVMLSFAGIPPLLGFYAKLMVIMALMQHNNILMAVAVLVLSVVSAGYALRIIKVIYFERPTTEGEFVTPFSFAQICLTLNVFALLVFGVFPAPLLNLMQTIFVSPLIFPFN